jgi:hypothetical protein
MHGPERAITRACPIKFKCDIVATKVADEGIVMCPVADPDGGAHSWLSVLVRFLRLAGTGIMHIIARGGLRTLLQVKERVSAGVAGL